MASQQEAFYAEQDQLDPPLVPEVQDEPVQGELIPNEIVVVPETAHKCSNCDYETVQAYALQRHMNSFIVCNHCTKTFCGKRAKQQHKSHQSEHKFKPKMAHTCEICSKCFQYPSQVNLHKLNSACGRQ